ncbi:hypothetical protein [Trichormus sp. NMC-1]|uniref:hypothetical protein n=1 Tax=Trichormus sp. NMC-1 TaxID=1853259 RepID=UPI0015A54B7D|nr:hypothetical protein [Trichormus sp. NMC-1]
MSKLGLGKWGDGEMGRWGDGETRRHGDARKIKNSLFPIPSSLFPVYELRITF